MVNSLRMSILEYWKDTVSTSCKAKLSIGIK